MDKDTRAKIVGKARADADFRARLLSDPKGAVAQGLGVAMPASLSVEVHEESATTVHLLLPAAGGLTEGEVEATGYNYDGPQTSILMERDFAAGPGAVFDAWRTPETASRWLFSTETGVTMCVMDPRPGGAYRIKRTEGGQTYAAVGEYREVSPPHRLVFTFGMPQFAADVGTVTVDLEPKGEGTHMRFSQGGNRPGYEDAAREGWSAMFDLLERALS